MRHPAESIFSIAGPGRLLDFISKARFLPNNLIECDDSVERPVRWLVGAIDHYFGLRVNRPVRLLDTFSKVVRFPTGEGRGYFPDTIGYESDDWESFESQMEDPSLLNFMMKSIDCVEEFNEKVGQRLEQSYDDVENFMSIPKFGGPVFMCVGVTMIGDKHESRIIQVPESIDKIFSKQAFADIIGMNSNLT